MGYLFVGFMLWYPLFCLKRYKGYSFSQLHFPKILLKNHRLGQKLVKVKIKIMMIMNVCKTTAIWNMV